MSQASRLDFTICLGRACLLRERSLWNTEHLAGEQGSQLERKTSRAMVVRSNPDAGTKRQRFSTLSFQSFTCCFESDDCQIDSVMPVVLQTHCALLRWLAHRRTQGWTLCLLLLELLSSRSDPYIYYERRRHFYPTDHLHTSYHQSY